MIKVTNKFLTRKRSNDAGFGTLSQIVTLFCLSASAPKVVILFFHP